jgi:hypothetical protein
MLDGTPTVDFRYTYSVKIKYFKHTIKIANTNFKIEIRKLTIGNRKNLVIRMAILYDVLLRQHLYLDFRNCYNISHMLFVTANKVYKL